MRAKMKVEGIHKSIGKDQIISDMSFELGEGESLSILGGSGCGKSTTLRIIAGLTDQDKGSIYIDGRKMDNVPASKRKIGFVFQDYSLFPHMTVEENIAFGPRMMGISRNDREKKVVDLLGLVGLSGYGKRRPGQLSGGQKQRVALARALAIDPALLLLDEPFGALDARIRKAIRRDLRRMQRELGISMLFVTHDQKEAFEVGDRIAIMNEGRFDQVGLPRDLYDHPRTRFVASFIGSMNVITVPARDGGPPMEVMVRPEDVRVLKVADGGKGTFGTLINYMFLGSQIEVSILLGNGKAVQSLMSKERFIMEGFRRGDGVRLKMRHLRYFNGPGQEGVDGTWTAPEKNINGALV
ncbi:MAG: ABC transporter ATP-binding protein [Thermoplasmata archaeon]|nr:ABC transporter ATP-binding protein [Thermoplasmata archaeon]